MSPQIRLLDATVSSLKQHKQSNSSLLKALEEENVSLEQENVSLKQELGAQKELAKVCTQHVKMFGDKREGCNSGGTVSLFGIVCVIQGFAAGGGNSELEVLRQENEALKAQMAQLSAQLLDVSSDTISPALCSSL